MSLARSAPSACQVAVDPFCLQAGWKDMKQQEEHLAWSTLSELGTDLNFTLVGPNNIIILAM